MKIPFSIIIIILVVLYGTWAYLAHSQGYSIQERYNELAQLPVYAYVADTTKVQPLLGSLKDIPGIASIKHETGFQAAKELIGAYELNLTDDMIAGYSFPDIITITFNASPGISTSKAQVMDILRTQLSEIDLDSQSGSFSNTLKELNSLKHRNLIFNIYLGAMSFIFFIVIRLSYELHFFLKARRRLVSVVDTLRHNKNLKWHTWLMLLLPVPLVCALYYAGWYFGHLYENLIPYWNFFAMAASSLLGSFTIAMALRVYEHDRILGAYDTPGDSGE